MSSDRIRWTQDERDAIVTCAVQYARGRTTSRLEALNLGMKAALQGHRHRNCVSVSHFGHYINEEFDRRLHMPEKIGEPLPKIGHPESVEVRVPAPPPQPEVAAPLTKEPDPLPQALAEGEEIVLNFPGVVIPASVINRIAASVEARVMARVMAIMQAVQAPIPCSEPSIEAAPLPQEPPQEGGRLQVIVVGLMPQRKQWLLNAIPARLKHRLDVEFIYEDSPITPQRDHIVIHCTLKGQSEVPQRLVSPGRYYRVGHNAMSVLGTLQTAADYHLIEMEQHHATRSH